MRRAVGADDAGAVDREHDRQVLQRNVVNQLVVGALEERRVDRDHRPHPLAREARRERDGVLLGDAHVEVAVGKRLREPYEPRAFAHRRRDGDEALVARRHVAEPVAEHLRVRGLGRRLGDDACSGIERRHAVVEDRVVLGPRVAVALLVITCRSCGPWSARTLASVRTSTSTSWPSIGPM